MGLGGEAEASILIIKSSTKYFAAGVHIGFNAYAIFFANLYKGILL